MVQAMAVVVLSSVAAGVGSFGMGGITPGAVLMGILASLAGWFLWAFLTYFIGTKLPPGAANPGRLRRIAAYHRLFKLAGHNQAAGCYPGPSGRRFG